MSPAVTPSVDCVLNREWRSDTGTPGPQLCSFSLARAEPSQRWDWAEFCRVLCQYKLTRTAVSEAGRSGRRFCCRIIFHWAHRDILCRNALDVPSWRITVCINVRRAKISSHFVLVLSAKPQMMSPECLGCGAAIEGKHSSLGGADWLQTQFNFSLWVESLVQLSSGLLLSEYNCIMQNCVCQTWKKSSGTSPTKILSLFTQTDRQIKKVIWFMQADGCWLTWTLCKRWLMFSCLKILLLKCSNKNTTSAIQKSFLIVKEIIKGSTLQSFVIHQFGFKLPDSN